jgi:hypothetical protein
MTLAVAAEGIVYREHMPHWVRVFCGVIGLSMFLIPIPYVMHNDWHTFSFATIVAIAAIIFPVLVGGMIVFVSVSGVRQLVFQNAQRMAVQTMRWPFISKRSEIAADRFRSVEVAMRDSEDGPYPVLKLFIHGSRPLTLVGFETRADAYLWKELIEAWIRN